MAFFIVVQYAGRASGGQEADPLYKWSFAIAGFSRARLGLRLPQVRWRTVGLVVAAFFATQAFEFTYIALAHPGNEQGLTPTHWQPSHAAEYVVNGVIVCTVVPFVEEVTFRGLGFYLLRPFGTWFAIVGTGVLFGLSHGLLIALPIIIVFGCVLGWLREKTNSVFPGMVLHSAFNLIALVAAVTTHR